MNNEHDDYNITFTKFELNVTLTECKGASPRGDGITQEILRLAVRKVLGHPLLPRHNMISETGVLPPSWTNNIIIPPPKPNQHDDCRRVYMTTCSKDGARRLLHSIREHLSPSLFGFRYIQSILDCMVTCLTLHTQHSYTTVLDLKAAFDMASRHIVLPELAKIDTGD
ncbi:uncharacterized protein [Panulirus ornatus]|uniref:uncharacterized protein n=1 Tax=Panulirus ornatus TaxID=150431 RepID=UPI003A8C4091